MEISPSPAEKPRRRSFWSLIATQFPGAFSNNAHKFRLIFLFSSSTMVEEREFLVLVVGILFPLPLVLFSMGGGYLEDRYSKRSVTIGAKLAALLIGKSTTAFSGGMETSPLYETRSAPSSTPLRVRRQYD